MKPLHLRYLTHMLRRMQHLVFLSYRDIAVDRGFLVATACEPPGWKSFRAGPGAAQLLNGEPNHDTAVLTNLMIRHYRSAFRSKDAVDDDARSDAGSVQFSEPVMIDPFEVAGNRETSSPGNDASVTSPYVLSVLRAIPRHLRPDEVAVIVLLAHALDESDVTSTALSILAKKTAWRVGIAGRTVGVSVAFARLLESGALLPRQFRLRDGNAGYSLSGRMHFDNAIVSRRTAISFALSELHNVGAERTKRLVSKTLRRRVPVLIADEEGGSWPDRLVAGLDLVLELPRLNVALLAVIIELCTNLSSADLKAEMLKRRLACERLDLDDLVLAAAPGRSAFEIVNRLVVLTDEFQADERETKKHSEETSALRTIRPGKDVKDGRAARFRSSKAVEIILPDPPDTGDGAAVSDHLPRVAVEALSGYGQAKDWALHLKDDLSQWRSGELQWSDLSTRLLLSGPPGTGKTTFARALCNSLQLPLHVSSVATWLEPGYLGEVLKRMSNAFSTAKENSPSILFIDELDGIGKRGDGSRHYDDYWRQVVNRALELLDGAVQTEGVVIIGATNFPNNIDSALLRSGRLETHIAIPKPDIGTLTDIIRYHLGPDLEGVVASAQSVGLSVEQKEASNV